MLITALALTSTVALALSHEAEEFIAITKQLEPLQCEKRKLRREIALAEIEHRYEDAKKLRGRFAALDRDPASARLERRLGELEPRLRASRDREDLEAISRQSRAAFFRCE